MHSDDLTTAAGTISRRMLLKSGAGALAAAYSLRSVPVWAARGARARIDEAAIPRLFEQTAKSLIAPGAFMLLGAPGVDLAAAYGTGILGRDRRIGPRDHFRIGSVTKTFTGTVIPQAAQRLVMAAGTDGAAWRGRVDSRGPGLVAAPRSERSRRPLGGSLPDGVVTFLLTDVEGSSRLWERDAEAMLAAISLHDGLVERAVAASGGVRPVEQGEGDSVVVAFGQASGAVACALELQRGLQAASWPEGCELRVRVALHSGEALMRDAGNYVGPALNRCARLRTLTHGGQTVVSRATYELVADSLPEEVSLRPLGKRRLQNLAREEELFELAHPELPSDFPPLRPLDAVPNNLPVALSSFNDRPAELARAGATAGRGVRLSGAGGCGKTRLASQVAFEVGCTSWQPQNCTPSVSGRPLSEEP